MEVIETNRWKSITALALLLAGIGVITDRALILLMASAVVGYIAYPRLTSKPEITLDLDRRISERSPEHGATVDVEVTLTNTGSLPLTDVRFVDGVPPTLSVVDGTPRHAAALRPGKSTSFSYTVGAKRGKHSFIPATVIARNISGSIEIKESLSEETVIDCASDLGDQELRRQATQYAGRVLTDTGGSGVEFHGTREYQTGDSLSRIDWKHRAKTGEFITLEFREERTASVVILIDARRQSYVAMGENEPHAVSYSVFASEQLFNSLLASRDSVGLAAIGRDTCWLTPGAGDEHIARARKILTQHQTLSPIPPFKDEYDPVQLNHIEKRLGKATQVLILTPLNDDYIVDAAHKMDEGGNSVSVISPDVTTENTTGRKIAKIERDERMSKLRQAEIPVVDWSVDTPLAKVLAHTKEKWTQ